MRSYRHVFSPPWNLEIPIRAAMPTLLQRLGQDERAAFDLQFQQT